jgi:UDP-glucose 4-epimerase
VYGDGRQTRDFIYVENVVAANVLAATAQGSMASGTVVNIGAGRSTSLLDLIRIIGGVSGRPLEYTTYGARAGDVRDSLADLERAERVLGYRSQVSLEEGLARTWQALVDGAAEAANARSPVARSSGSPLALPQPI